MFYNFLHDIIFFMIYLPSNYAYLFLCLPFLIIWLILYMTNKSTRREQLSMSCIGLIAGPLSEIIYFKDYWLPKSALSLSVGHFPLMIEDILFGFAIGGIGAVIFEVLFRTQLQKLSKKPKYTLNVFALLFIFFVVLKILLLFGINSIYASAFAFVVTAIPILFIRHDLFLNAIGSGISVMLIMFISYFILFHIVSNTQILFKEQWLIYGTSLDLRFAGIPLTEMVWGFTWGFLAGPLYEFKNNRKNIIT